jgi:hypothetical protein
MRGAIDAVSQSSPARSQSVTDADSRPDRTRAYAPYS